MHCLSACCQSSISVTINCFHIWVIFLISRNAQRSTLHAACSMLHATQFQLAVGLTRVKVESAMCARTGRCWGWLCLSSAPARPSHVCKRMSRVSLRRQTTQTSSSPDPDPASDFQRWSSSSSPSSSSLPSSGILWPQKLRKNNERAVKASPKQHSDKFLYTSDWGSMETVYLLHYFIDNLFN